MPDPARCGGFSDSFDLGHDPTPPVVYDCFVFDETCRLFIALFGGILFICFGTFSCNLEKKT